MAHVAGEYRVCVDCTMFLANGPDDLDAETVERVVAGVERIQANGGHLVCTSSEETDACFSWRHCECCLSPLGGSRHDATLLCDGPEPK